MFYLFYASTVFDTNKIIGILPFGETISELNKIEIYYELLNSKRNSKLDVESPFKTFIQELRWVFKGFSFSFGEPNYFVEFFSQFVL